MKTIIWIILLTCSVFSQILYNSIGHIPSASQIDWTRAGLLVEGNEILPKQLINVTSLLNPGDPIDQKITQAISDARTYVHNTGGLAIIYFPQGVYNISMSIQLAVSYGDSNIVFKGDGSDKTTLVFQVGDNKNFNCFDIWGTSYTPVDLNQNFNKGDSIFYSASGILSDLSITPPNNWIHIYKYDFDYGKANDPNREKEIVGQVEKLVALGTSNDWGKIEGMAHLDFVDSPNTNYSLKVRRIHPIKNIGIEDMTINCSTSGKATVDGKGIIFKFSNAINCWVKGVEAYNPPRHHLTTSRCSHLEISGNYFHHAAAYCGGGYGYGVTMYGSTTHCLIENNCFRRLRHALVLGGGANGNVWTFNYSREQHWDYEGLVPDIADMTTRDLDLHAKYPFANLFEHNWVKEIGADDAHGQNGPYNAFLRNAVYNDEDDEWGKIILKNCPQASFLGCELNHHIDLQGSSSLTTNIYGSFNAAYKTHEYMLAYDLLLRRTAILEDVSYYYSDKPDFLNPAQYKWPALGAAYYQLCTQSIPAANRWDDAKPTYIDDPTTPTTTADTLAYDEYWVGSITCTDDVTVPAGITLTIDPSAQISFPDGKKLVVYGTLNAIGTSTEEISFACSDAGEDWYGISFENGSSGELKYCSFNDAFYAVYGKQSAPKVSYCSFHNGMYALYAYMGDWNSSPFTNNDIQDGRIGVIMSNTSNLLVDQCTIDGSSVFGIRTISAGSSNELTENDIKNSARDGIYMYNSDPYLFDNDIYYNGDDGIYMYSGSDPNLHDFAGNNVVAYNDEWGINVSSGCVPVLGAHSCDWEDGNSYYSNGIGELYSASSSPINARNNWWGQIYADTTLLRITGNFYCSPMLGFMDPNPEIAPPLSKSLAEDNSSESTEIQSGAIDSVAMDLFTKAHRLQTAKKFDEAIPIYQQIINEHPYSQHAEMAVVRLARCYKRTDDKSEGKTVIADYTEHKSEAVAIAAQYEAGDWELDDDNIDAAIDYFTGVAHAKKRAQKKRCSTCGIFISI